MSRSARSDNRGPVAGRSRPAVRGAHRGARPVAFAALDLGTNNCRLLIATPSGDGFTVVDAFSRIVRLGEGMGEPDDPLVLSEPAMRRTVKALQVCAGKMRRRGVQSARCVATEACRRAANARGFLRRVKRQTGIEIEVITCAEEAELAAAGCAPLIDPAARHALIFDIGGGSTELTWVDLSGARPNILGAQSIPCGVINLAERFGCDSFTPEAYETMLRHVAALIAPFEQRHRIAAVVRDGGVQMIGTSGTVTTLAGVDMDLPRYDRARVDGTRMPFDRIRHVSRTLAAHDLDGRAAHPCIGRSRADLVVGGCALLEAMCETWPVGALTVADRGVREGILYDLMAADRRAGGGARARPLES